MSKQIRRAAVLGSGVMGSAIAAHLTNAGVETLVLDIAPNELTEAEQAKGLTLEDRRVRNRIVDGAVARMSKAKPAAFFSKQRRGLLHTGNFEDDLAKLAGVDWIVEAVREEVGIKHQVLKTVAPHVGPHAWLTTNTSGLSIETLAEALPDDLRKRFAGTHFFNPPRYMKLLELIPTSHTDPAVLEAIGRFAEARLGKGIVVAKDTPNFIANRIGVHAMLATIDVMQQDGLTVEEIDALTGPALGRPKTATFALADLVGLDTLLLVADTLKREAAGDECAELYEPPAPIVKMVEAGMLGRKSGAGFFKMVKKPKKKLLTIDLDSHEYRDPQPVQFAELAPLKKIADPAKRIETLVFGEGKGAASAWKILAATLSYSAMRLGEIADDADAIDRGVKLGFNWDLGPFEAWNALGFRRVTERLRADGYALPEWVTARFDAGAETLFERDGDDVKVPTATPGAMVIVPRDSKRISFADLHRDGKVVESNDSASLVDLGDDVLGVQFHSKMNAIDQDTIAMIERAADVAESGPWCSIVVANDGVNFSAGANLMMVVGAAQAGQFDVIEELLRRSQFATLRMETCGVPVVTAPFAMTLAGGCELAMMGDAIQAHAETYIGLVEVGVGLIPASAGCLRLYQRNLDRHGGAPKDLLPAFQATFEVIAQAKVSTSAEEGQQLGFLRAQDAWTMNRDHLVADAKAVALAHAGAGYQPPDRQRSIPVMGRAGLGVVDAFLVNMHEGRFISDHDRRIGRELGKILAGGDVAGPTMVSDEYILELEREAFLRLLGEKKTHERIEAMLKTGKPLRN